MKKIMFAVVAAVLAIGMLAGPAFAAAVGVVQGATAEVSKGADANGCADGSGGGIGLPLVNDGKKAYYDFSGSGIGSTGGVPAAFSVAVCGQIDPVAGIGAACGMSSGRNGDGSVTGGITATLTDLGWPASAGSAFVVTGDAGAAGGVLALVSAKNVGTQCVDKSETSKSGSMNFLVDIVVALVPAATGTHGAK